MEVLYMKEKIIIVGAGPCGLSTALYLKEAGYDPLIIDRGNIVHTIYRFPTHQTFFSTSEKLEIGNMPFVSPNSKPVRMEALSYYREVVKRNNLRIHPYDDVIDVQKESTRISVTTLKNGHQHVYEASFVVMATGYYDQPQWMGIKGEHLEKVSHYFKEAHPYFGTDVAVIGGKNSAVDAALELYHAGANVTVFYRGKDYSPSIKPWILPEFDSLVQKGEIQMHFNVNVLEIKETTMIYELDGKQYSIPNDFIFAMTGYKPNISFLEKCHIQIDKETGRPIKNDATFETNIENIYVAGVIISGYNGNETFIENGRFHGGKIAAAIIEKCKK